MFKNELSLRKEKSHLTSKRLDELINSGRKSYDKRGFGFVDDNSTPSSGKTMLIKSSDEESSKENHPKLKFHCTYYDKMEHTFIDAMQECLITFKESWPT